MKETTESRLSRRSLSGSGPPLIARPRTQSPSPEVRSSLWGGQRPAVARTHCDISGSLGRLESWNWRRVFGPGSSHGQQLRTSHGVGPTQQLVASNAEPTADRSRHPASQGTHARASQKPPCWSLRPANGVGRRADFMSARRTNASWASRQRAKRPKRSRVPARTPRIRIARKPSCEQLAQLVSYAYAQRKPLYGET
jgi:hypothetical protein